MSTNTLQDQNLARAVSRVSQRSERSEIGKLIETFVDIGVLPQVDNRNHQIIYGRRGTGKTHVYKVLQSQLKSSPLNIACYIDARTLGSTLQFSDSTLPLQHRCICLFRDLLAPIQGDILEFVVDHQEFHEYGLNALDELANLIVDGVAIRKPTSSTESVSNSSATTRSIGAKISSLPSASVSARSKADEATATSAQTKYDLQYQDKIHFPELHTVLGRTLTRMKATLWIFLDEWSSIPLDIQPYLAEFLKRSILPLNNAVLKIAALEFRSDFGRRKDDGSILGFELGSDIAINRDLDDYYVYERDPERITQFFAEILFRHLSTELPEDYLATTHNIREAGNLPSRLFSETSVFHELVRASEGVARDFINIFTEAFFDASRRGRPSIDKQSVLEAARGWFEKDKNPNLDESLSTALRKIVDDVIGTRQARSFLLPRELERHPIIQRLFDARVLHLMKRGYADKYNPGQRYNIYSLDYGTYVDLLNTSKRPKLEFVDSEEPTEELIVPFDDKRSIRRIILSKEILDQIPVATGRT